ncbi:MAG: hypothetical protein MJ239_05965 [Bacilli bacterium]|nr:hypothetical protein [Bacilli bacterium]
MKKFRTIAFLATVGTVGSLFAAEWSFLELSGDPVKEEASVIGSIADAETIDLALVGEWTVTTKTLAVAYSNPDADNKGYAVEATVSGEMVFTYTIKQSDYQPTLVDIINASASMATYSIDAGNVKATGAFDSSKVTVIKSNTAGTIVVTVPSTAVTVTCTGAFTKLADYTAFKAAVESTSLTITATATPVE